MWGDSLNLYDTILKQPKKIQGMRAAHLMPSSASAVVFNKDIGENVVQGGCLRKQYLQFFNEPASDHRVDVDTIGTFTLGDTIQDWLENRFKEAGVFVQSELAIYSKEYNLSGRIDTILKSPNPDGSWELIGQEIKSKDAVYMGDKFIKPRIRGAVPTDFRPDPEHMYQSMLYLWACKTLPALIPYNIQKWFITYVLRGNGQFNWFELEMTDDTYHKGAGWPIIYSKVVPEGFVLTSDASIDMILSRYSEVKKMIEDEVLPNRDFHLTYNHERLDKLNTAGKLNRANTAHVAKGMYHKVSMKDITTDVPMGDKACMYCKYKSKCWGLGDYKAEEFVCTKATTTVSLPNIEESV